MSRTEARAAWVPLAPSPSPARALDRAWFVVNPRAGGVRAEAMEAEIRRRAPGPVTVTSAVPDAGEARLVVAVGGDGTVNRLLNAAAPTPAPLGVIPRGSANDLARALGIPAGLDGAWRALEHGRLADIDLVSVNGVRFATCGGLGLAAGVAARANRWKRRPHARALGPAVYVLAALAEIRRTGSAGLTVSIRTAQHERTQRLVTLLVSNQARFGRWFTASPRARHDDGLVHLCGIAVPRTRARLLWICAQLLGGRPDACPEVFQIATAAATVETGAPATFFGDGEVLTEGRRFEIAALPGALRVVTGGGLP